MSASTSRLSYQDAYDILDRAVANEKGIRVHVPDFGAGNNLRLRLHQARKIDREDNRDTYPEDHKLHGRSVYDPLVARLKQGHGKWWLYLEKMSAESLTIEPLGEENVITETTDGHLREAGPESGGEPRSEAVEETIDVFDGEAERPPEPVEGESPAPVQARRRV